MSGPGDIDGEVSGDEAAWRDLIARFDVPAERSGKGVPWPASEDLPDATDGPADAGAEPPADHARSSERDTRSADRETRPTDRDSRPTEHGTRPGDRGPRPGDRGPRPTDHRPRSAKHAGDWPALDVPSDRPSGPPRHRGPSDRTAGPTERSPGATDHGAGLSDRTASAANQPDVSSAPADRLDMADGGTRADAALADLQGGTNPAATQSDALRHPAGSAPAPPDRARVIRPAGDPRSYSPPEEEDERYVPTPLPPPPKMDSMTKAALVGVIGGPGYLLVATIFLHWTISAEAALVAVGAFVAGFVTLVVKLGDRTGRDDDDDGAVL
jgi:hypothetical protein